MVFAGDNPSWDDPTWAEEWENIVGLFRDGLPLLFVIGFPIIVTVVIVVIIKIIKFSSIATTDLFRSEESEDEEHPSNR